MNKCVLAAALATTAAFALVTPATAQVRYEVSGAVKSVSLQGDKVTAEIDLVILDGRGNPVSGFQTVPGVSTTKAIEVRAYLCSAANTLCSFEKMTTVVGEIPSIGAYGLTSTFPANSTPYPGLYLMQGARRIFWISVRETVHDFSAVNAASFRVVGQGSAIVSASGQ